MLRIIKRITPRSGAVDTDPCQVIFGGASSPVIRQNKNITGGKIVHPFHVWTHPFQRKHIDSVFVQSAQIIKRVGNTAQYIALAFV